MSRTIRVTRTWQVAAGEKNGKSWTIFGVEANDAEGQPIPHTLKSFANLPLGDVQVDVEPQNDPKYGPSFMLKPVRDGGGGGGGRGAAASGSELAELRARIERLESEQQRLSGLVDRREPGNAPHAPPRLVTSAGIPDADDDIPF